MIRLLLLSTLAAAPVAADTLVAARTIRAQSVIMPEDLALISGDILGALGDPADALGLEARVMLYAGRPIRANDLGAPAVIERNQIVVVHYRNGPVMIAMEGRALARGAVGDRLRVMNLGSRSTISGVVTEDGRLEVTDLLQ
jgi:flagella basal body P-ring formation protein FlgA